MEALTKNQCTIINNLIEEFKQMNTSRVSLDNPLASIFSELQSDKSHCDELNKIAQARVEVLRLEVDSQLRKLSNYFDELNLELAPIRQESNRSFGQALSYRIRGEEMIQVHGFIEYKWKRVGEYHYDFGHKIKYELGIRSHTSYNSREELYELGILSHTSYNSLEELIESSEFKRKVSVLLKAILKNNQDA